MAFVRVWFLGYKHCGFRDNETYIPPGGEKKWKRKQTSKETAVPYGRKLLGHREIVCVFNHTSVSIIMVVKRTNLTFFPQTPDQKVQCPLCAGNHSWFGLVMFR